MRNLSFTDRILGRPLASEEEDRERLGSLSGIGVFGLDALSSAAYGPEAALTVLIPLGAVGLFYIVPITAAICALLAIVYLSYRQTIAAYPSGGGSYTVAYENLGPNAGLLAAAALMVDYLLNVAVGISAGVGAIISAIPRLQPHTLSLCLLILLAVTIVNLRGMRESGLIFMLPTALFVGTLMTGRTALASLLVAQPASRDDRNAPDACRQTTHHDSQCSLAPAGLTNSFGFKGSWSLVLPPNLPVATRSPSSAVDSRRAERDVDSLAFTVFPGSTCETDCPSRGT